MTSSSDLKKQPAPAVSHSISLHLVIKASCAADVLAAIQQHNLPVPPYPQPSRIFPGEYIITLDTFGSATSILQITQKVHMWFAETSSPPYPSGALLFFGIVDTNPDTDNK